jgi:hypothetical protein
MSEIRRTEIPLLAIVDLQRRLITTEDTGRHTLGALSSKT